MQQPSVQITISSQPRTVKSKLVKLQLCSSLFVSTSPHLFLPSKSASKLSKNQRFSSKFPTTPPLLPITPITPPFCFNPKSVSKSSENTQTSRNQQVSNTSSVLISFQPVTIHNGLPLYSYLTVSNSTPLTHTDKKKSRSFNRLFTHHLPQFSQNSLIILVPLSSKNSTVSSGKT